MADLLRTEGLGRSFGGVRALDSVSLTIREGEVHAICGENGAGKSTLIRIVCGALRPSEGRVLWRGSPLPEGVHRCEQAGVCAIHQEPVSFPELSAVDNVFLGWEPRRGPLLDAAAMRRRTREALEELGETVPLDRPVGELAMAQRQMVALARALVRECRLLILDEPTAALSAREVRALFRSVRRLRERGVAVLYVSHRLEEVFALADRITVLRDGRLVETMEARATDREGLIRRMVGRELTALGAWTESAGGEALRLEDLTLRGAFERVSLTVRSGEVVGLSGLVGAGRTELLEAVYGLRRPDAGRVVVGGEPLRPGSVRSALAAGVALVPEDRQRKGLIASWPVAWNVSMASLAQVSRWGWIRFRVEDANAEEMAAALRIKCAGVRAAASSLSGGNQQKVVLAKGLRLAPRVLLLDEPTRGVDVAAKREVHQLVRRLASQGAAVLAASSDMTELLALCDRILALRGGRVSGELPRSEFSEAALLRLILPEEGSA
ncbi:MAG: sugar ABC transporter ATP-binding protein [Fimbriimonadales bacterium]|nr:sugar ABC transporter ATP-binding protein [Fimbriimonadales bacterium]